MRRDKDRATVHRPFSLRSAARLLAARLNFSIATRIERAATLISWVSFKTRSARSNRASLMRRTRLKTKPRFFPTRIIFRGFGFTWRLRRTDLFLPLGTWLTSNEEVIDPRFAARESHGLDRSCKCRYC